MHRKSILKIGKITKNNVLKKNFQKKKKILKKKHKFASLPPRDFVVLKMWEKYTFLVFCSLIVQKKYAFLSSNHLILIGKNIQKLYFYTFCIFLPMRVKG